MRISIFSPWSKTKKEKKKKNIKKERKKKEFEEIMIIKLTGTSPSLVL